jgi:dsDNA-specific endonuclease/ATPase MutS2
VSIFVGDDHPLLRLKAAQAGLAQTKEIYRRVKHHHLFAKTKTEKQQVLTELVAQSEVLSELAQAVSQQVSTRCGQVKQRAAATLRQLVEVARTLLPQIQQWLQTGKVATEKILHAGIPAARAIPKGGGSVKFGMKW